MRYSSLGPFEDISRLTLGGGGLGQGWGESSADEAAATVNAAVDAGINLLDTAPMYGSCEAVIASAFQGVLPSGVRITTKCQLGTPSRGMVAKKLEESLDASLAAMRLDRVDIYFLHSNICEDDYVYAHRNDQRAGFATAWSQYVEEVIPAFEDLKRRGRIGGWGITGIGVPETIIKALLHDIKPDVVQAIANLLDSPGGIRRFSEPPRPRSIIAAANAQGVGVMGIRAVQAGALTAEFDRFVKASHPEAADYERAAPFRALCAALGVDPALLAHRYALDMEGVDTVVLGVKNRVELEQCVEAEAQGALPPDLRARIDGLGLAESSVSVLVLATEALSPERRAAVIDVCIEAHDDEEFHRLFGFIPSGGRHFLAYLGPELVSHAVVTTRWVQPEGHPVLRTAYVDAVATRPIHQNLGYGSATLNRMAAEIGDYEIACLQTDRVAFYERLGWEVWRGPLAGRGEEGLIPTPEQRGVMVFRLPGTPPLDLDSQLTIECQAERIWE